MKITKATIKSFIRKNVGNLYFYVNSSFDGMTDCVQPVNSGWKKSQSCSNADRHTLGQTGLWLVGGSRDYFTPYENAEYTGYEISNCCGLSIIAVKKGGLKWKLRKKQMVM